MPARALGAFWAKELNAADRDGRICKVDVDPAYPVHTAWDLGIDDAMAIWCFQASPGALHIVDYYESSGYGFDHYCAWLDDRGYHGTDYVPHDARMRELGSPGGRTRIETLFTLGRKPKIVPNHKVPDRINAGRKTIPLAKFDATRCAKGLEALREYKAEWDEEARTFKRTPNHDWASHAADAWGYLSVGWNYAPKLQEKKSNEPRTNEQGVWALTVDDLLDIHGRGEVRVRV